MFTQISYWAFKSAPPLANAMAMAKRAGFDGIELCIAGTGPLTPRTTTDECRRIAEQAKAIGIRLGSVASGMLWSMNPASAGKATRDKALDVTKRQLRVTADLGAGALLVLPGQVDVAWEPAGEVVPYDQCYKRAMTFAKAVCRAAEKLGVQAAFENVWNKFLLSPLEFKQFVDNIGSKSAGMYFDVGNVWAYGYPQHWIKILGRRIKRVHVKDYKRQVGTLAGFCQIGDGDVPLAESLRLLGASGYKGPVTAEVSPGPDDTDDFAFIKKTRQRLGAVMP